MCMWPKLSADATKEKKEKCSKGIKIPQRPVFYVHPMGTVSGNSQRSNMDFISLDKSHRYI